MMRCRIFNLIIPVAWLLCLFFCVKARASQSVVLSVDSLKSIYNKSGNDSVKSLRAIDVCGVYFNRNSQGSDARNWLATAWRHAKISGSKTCIGYCYIYSSYLLDSKLKEIKYKYLDSASAVFPRDAWDGRSFLLNIRVRFDLAYDMKPEAKEDLALLKKVLDSYNPGAVRLANLYYVENAFLYWNQENYPECMNNFLKAYNLLVQKTSGLMKQDNLHVAPGYFVNSFTTIASAANNTGLTYYKLDSIQKAVSYYKKGLEYYKLADDHPGLAWSYQLMGECYSGLGMPNEASSWIFKAIEQIKLISRNSSDFNQGGAYVDAMEVLYDILSQTGKYELFISTIDECYNYVYKVYQTTGLFYQYLAELQLQKAKAYARINQPGNIGQVLKLAEPYIFKNSYDATMEHKEVTYMVRANYSHYYMLQAWQCYVNGNHAGYIQLRDKALYATDNIRDWIYRIKSYNNIKWYLIKAKDYNTVISHHSIYFTHLRDKKDLIKQRDYTGELSQAYAALGQGENAYKYETVFSLLNDSIRSMQQFYALADVAEKYQDEAEKTALRNQNIEMAKNHSRNVFLFITVIIAFALLSIVLLLNRQRLRTLHKYEKAEKEKLQILVAHEEKELSDTREELIKSNSAYEGLLQGMEQIGKNVKGDHRPQLRQLILGQKMVSQEESWNQFNNQFQKMNPRFYNRILETVPSLTDSERKICALMTLGLSNKEISLVTFQPIASIYTYKNRLRKKFSYTSDEELSYFFSQFLGA